MRNPLTLLITEYLRPEETFYSSYGVIRSGDWLKLEMARINRSGKAVVLLKNRDGQLALGLIRSGSLR